MTAEWAQVIVGLMTLVGVVVTSVVGFLSHHHAKQANDAVNHTHGTGRERIYDLVLKNTGKIDEIKEDTELLKERIDRHEIEIKEIKHSPNND